MKDKLEVGHFIRTIKGIGRIEEITEDRTKIYFNCDTGLTISFIKKDFTQEEMAQYYKHSDNIIDLIEVGDYLNGFKVSKIERYDTNTIIKIGNSTFNVLEGEKIYTPSCDNNNSYEKIEKLKSIVTKEQFESISYKLEGKDENI